MGMNLAMAEVITHIGLNDVIWYLPKPFRFRKSIVYILLVGNQWTSLYNVIMVHINSYDFPIYI